MPTPSAIAVATEHNWVGSAQIYNILKPSIDPSLAKVWGNQNFTGLFDILAGGKNPVASLQYRHYEEDRLHTIIKATGTSAVAAANVTYTIVSGYSVTPYPASAVSPYIATGTTVTLMPVRVGDTLSFPGDIRGTVTSINAAAGTFVVTPDSATVALPTTVSTDQIINMGVSVGEDADTPTSLNFRLNEYSNNMQIMVDAHKVTGSASAEQTWVPFQGENGQTAYLWYYKGQHDTSKRFDNFREFNLLAGKKITNTTTMATYDATLLKTEGLDTFAQSYGNITSYSLVTGITLSDFETMAIDQLDKNKAAAENSIWASIRLRQGIDGFIRDTMKQGAILYNSFTGGKEQAVNFGFDSFTTLGYTFHLKTYQLFNDPTTFGATGQKWSNYGWVVPMEQSTYRLGEMKEKVDVPPVRMNYQSQTPAGGTFSREKEEWLTGGTNGIYTTTTDNVKLNFRSTFGFEGFGANRFAVMQGI
jgi:hypothetical protein